MSRVNEISDMKEVLGKLMFSKLTTVEGEDKELHSVTQCGGTTREAT